jgi:hypothetical protein
MLPVSAPRMAAARSWARAVRAVCRQMSAQVRAWDWSRPSTSFPVLKVSSVGHRWHRSSHAAFSWLCSLFLVGFLFLFWRCPAGAGVEAGRACPAFA